MSDWRISNNLLSIQQIGLTMSFEHLVNFNTVLAQNLIDDWVAASLYGNQLVKVLEILCQKVSV